MNTLPLTTLQFGRSENELSSPLVGYAILPTAAVPDMTLVLEDKLLDLNELELLRQLRARILFEVSRRDVRHQASYRIRDIHVAGHVVILTLTDAVPPSDQTWWRRLCSKIRNLKG